MRYLFANPGGSRRRAHLEPRARCSFLRIRRSNDESGLWLCGVSGRADPRSSWGAPL